MSESTSATVPHLTTGIVTADGRLELDTSLPLRGRVSVTVTPLVEVPVECILETVRRIYAAQDARGYVPDAEAIEAHVRSVQEGRDEWEEVQLAREALQEELHRLRQHEQGQ